mmetsp:Transcript_21083/g.47569  ORF Transcript_21083/g.47569 Transcript_21083/m.47569 type:complete len:268 (-) Transcript_21083:208-1011(-)
MMPFFGVAEAAEAAFRGAGSGAGGGRRFVLAGRALFLGLGISTGATPSICFRFSRIWLRSWGRSAVKIWVYTPSLTACLRYWKELNARVRCGDKIFQQMTESCALSFTLFTAFSQAITRQPLAGPKEAVAAHICFRGRFGSPTDRPGSLWPSSGSSIASALTRVPSSSAADLAFALTFGVAFIRTTFALAFALALALALALAFGAALALALPFASALAFALAFALALPLALALALPAGPAAPLSITRTFRASSSVMCSRSPSLYLIR